MIQHKTWYLSPSAIHGTGVFASQHISKGTKIDRACIMVGNSRGLTMLGKHVNHQKQANCELRKENCTYWLYAIENVPKGTEFVADYTTLSAPFSAKTEGFTERAAVRHNHYGAAPPTGGIKKEWIILGLGLYFLFRRT